MAAKILTANRLRDGLVVYLAGDGGWTEALSQASLARTEEDGAKSLEIGAQAVASRHVVDPYLIEVADHNGAVRPVRFREAIRANGPTVETLRDAPANER